MSETEQELLSLMGLRPKANPHPDESALWVALHSGPPSVDPGAARTPIPRVPEAWVIDGPSNAPDDGAPAQFRVWNGIPIWCERPKFAVAYWSIWSRRVGGRLRFFGPIELEDNVIPAGRISIEMD